MKKVTPFHIIFFFAFVLACLFVGGAPAWAQAPLPAPWPDEPGAIPELIGGKKADRPMVFIEPVAPTQGTNSAAESTIDVWYGGTQSFGKKGNPQQWVNILGNVTDATGIKAVTYSLNGKADQPLSIGPDKRRLVNDGDFNAEIDYADLKNGSNTVTIKVTDINDQVTKKKVTLNYTRGRTWPENYDADWTAGADIQDIAQVVDGKWDINGAGKLYPVEVGYDRLVAIGDVGNSAKKQWTDYEVTVPIKVKGLDDAGFEGVSNGAGIGLFLRWQGHTLKDNEQPRLNQDRLGGIGWYRWKDKDGDEGLELRGHDWRKSTSTAKVWEFDKTYILKMSVQSLKDSADTRAYYRLKFWEQGTDEPVAWDIEGYSKANNSPSGSAVLVAHHVDAEFGDVKIRSLEDLAFKLTTNVTGNGIITKNPPVSDNYQFEYGEKITLKALPDPGYYLESWSGDVAVPGTIERLDINMTMDMSITANFKMGEPGTLTVDIEGEGEVIKDPDKEGYDGGELVTLTAVAKPGYLFAGWSGDLSGTLNPAQIRIDGDKTVKATFAKLEASLVSDEFNRCELYTELWTFVNPSESGTLAFADGELQLTVPAGPSMTMWDGSRDAPRIMQDTEDEDFTVDIKFDSIPQENNHFQGLLVEADADNWIRFDIHRENDELRMMAAVTTNGSSTQQWNEPIIVAGSSEIYMRVNRTGNTWTQAYSLNGVDWQTPQDPTNFYRKMTVSKTGIFAANPNAVGAPAFVARVDYFRNADFPVGITGYLLSYDVVGTGDVDLEPQPNVNGRYVCNQQVALHAAPEEMFIGWSGDLTGEENPATITMDADKSVTASFGGTYVLNIDVVGDGQVTIDPDQEKYLAGDEVTLTAVAGSDWVFAGWSGDAGGFSNPLAVTMDSDKNIEAKFAKPIIFTPVITRP